ALAGAVRAEEAERLAALHVEGDAVDGGERPELLPQAAGVDHGRSRAHDPSLVRDARLRARATRRARPARARPRTAARRGRGPPSPGTRSGAAARRGRVPQAAD